MLINPGLAASTHINLTVPLLTTLAILLLKIDRITKPIVLSSPRRPRRMPPCPTLG
jgi:hypothetical protein